MRVTKKVTRSFETAQGRRVATKFLSIRNFEKFQHYKHRNPPWVKLYYDLLDDEAFLTMSIVSRHHYMALLLVAGRKNNRLPDDGAVLKKLMRLDEEPDLSELKEKGFLIAWRERHARRLIATCVQNALSEAETETEAETEAETEKEEEGEIKVESGDSTVPLPVYPGELPWEMQEEFEAFWRDYPRKVHKRRAERAWWYLRQEGVTVAEILQGLEAALVSEDWATDLQFIPHPARWLNGGGWES